MLILLFAVFNTIKRFREAASSSTCSDFHDWFCHENHCMCSKALADLSGWKDLLHHQTKNTQKLHSPNNIPLPEAQQRGCYQTFNSFQKKWGCYTGPSVLRHVAARKFKLTFFPLKVQTFDVFCAVLWKIYRIIAFSSYLYSILHHSIFGIGTTFYDIFILIFKLDQKQRAEKKMWKKVKKEKLSYVKILGTVAIISPFTPSW